MLAVVVLAILLAAGLGRLGNAMVLQQRAQAVADVVALAAAAHGVDAAVAVARRNGASVVRSWGDPSGSVQVTVRLREGPSAAAAAGVDGEHDATHGRK